MNFDWRYFTEKDFANFCEKMKDDIEYDNEYVDKGIYGKNVRL